MRSKSWGQNNKSFFDKIIQNFRLFSVKKYVNQNSILLDIGCGYNAELLHLLSNKISKGIGIDISINKPSSSNIKLLKSDINSKINLPSNSVDIITILAVIEHIKNPMVLLNEARRILKKGGYLIITTPNAKWKFLLDSLANLNLISKLEIRDHKKYYDSKLLNKYLIKTGFSSTNIQTTCYPTKVIFDFVVMSVVKK